MFSSCVFYWLRFFSLQKRNLKLIHYFDVAKDPLIGCKDGFFFYHWHWPCKANANSSQDFSPLTPQQKKKFKLFTSRPERSMLARLCVYEYVQEIVFYFNSISFEMLFRFVQSARYDMLCWRDVGVACVHCAATVLVIAI